jgi:hypothetical protein
MLPVVGLIVGGLQLRGTAPGVPVGLVSYARASSAIHAMAPMVESPTV